MFTKTILVSALAALAAAQSNALLFTNPLPAPAEVDKPIELTYATTDASTPVVILLRKGDANDLHTVATLTSSATGGSFVWIPSGDLEDGTDYALQIQQGSEVNYLGPFTLKGGSGTASSTSTSTSHSAPPGYGDSTSITLTATASANGTASTTVTTALAPYGTGNATIPRNNTMSSATLTRTSTPTGSSGSGAGFQGSQTGSDAAQSTGAASTLMIGSGAIALVFGALIMGY